MVMHEPDDATLVARAQRGDRTAVDALFRRHWDDAWRLARSVAHSDATADDCAQEAFVRAIAGLRGLRERGAFRGWLHRIVLNLTFDAVRREKRDVPSVPETFDHAAAPADEGIAAALALTAEIAPEQRAVLVLRHCLGYSLAETAEILKLPVGTVQSRAARGLREMRLRLGVNDGH